MWSIQLSNIYCDVLYTSATILLHTCSHNPFELSGASATVHTQLNHVYVGEKALHLQGDFTWEESAEPSLTDLDAAMNSGDLMVVVGPTGSGKSSLLGAALGLMQQVSGNPVNLRGKASTLNMLLATSQMSSS